MKTLKSNQSGFAIGTILLAVVLIAAIVSAIAIASRGTSGQQNREQARVQASTLLQQAVNLRSGFERLNANGVPIRSISMAGDGATPSVTTNASQADSCADSVGSVVCLYDTDDGGAAIQSPPRQAFRAPGGPMNNRWMLAHEIDVGDTASALNGNTVILVGNVNRAVCQQINNLVHGLAFSDADNPPVFVASGPDTTGSNLEPAAPGDGTATPFETFADDELEMELTQISATTTSSAWVEGCATETGGDNTAETATFYYYRTVN